MTGVGKECGDRWVKLRGTNEPIGILRIPARDAAVKRRDAHQRVGSFIDAPILAEPTVETRTASLVEHTIGPYQVVSLLGRGGMGEVYQARDTRLDRTVALKILPAQVAADNERMQRFVREAKAASALNHPHVATIYEIGTADGVSFIAMEYIEGQSLAAKINGQPLTVKEIVEFGSQMADALDEAHSKGITHRDIKPANVMLNERDQVKVLDFGLAKITPLRKADFGFRNEKADNLPSEIRLPQLTELGVVMGTVPYMSPEQALGRDVDHRSDIFSLGVVLYEMATGRLPFAGTNSSETLDLILHAQPEPIARFNYHVPAELERIVRKCLEKERERRYQAARELLVDLKNLQRDSDPKAALMTARSAKVTATTRRIKEVGARFVWGRWPVIAAVAAVLLVALVWIFVGQRTPVVQPDQIKSLAMLPLENLSGDAAPDYFVDGMTETLIAGLSKVAALRVSSRTSVMQYKGTRKPLPDIARELKVDAVIEGSVQRVGDRVKITARLIHALTERSLWSETYERELHDILALQNEIARAVIEQIQIKLTPQEQLQLANARPVNPQAYDEYLRGRFFANRQNKADNETTIQALERAVALDPTFAAAQAELAQAYVWRFFLFTPDEKQWEEKAFVAVEKALSLDPNLAVAHLARGRLHWTSANHFPHDQAIQEYRRALALNPSLDEAQNQLALVYGHIGAFDQALQELQKAVTNNPTNNLVHFRVGETLLFQGKYEQALTALRKAPREANPVLATSFMAMVLLHLERKDEAMVIVNEFLRDNPENTNVGLFASIQAILAALTNEEKQAEGKIRNAIEKGKGFGHFHHTAYNIACAYSLMKKPEPAINWLQAAAEDGFPCYPLFERDPFLDHLRKDQHFIAMMAKLKEEWEAYRTKL